MINPSNYVFVKGRENGCSDCIFFNANANNMFVLCTTNFEDVKKLILYNAYNGIRASCTIGTWKQRIPVNDKNKVLRRIVEII